MLLAHSYYELHKMRPVVATGLDGKVAPYCVHWGPGPITVWQFFIATDNIVREYPIDTAEQVAAVVALAPRS